MASVGGGGVDSEDVLAVFEIADLLVLTVTEGATTPECSRPTAYNKLARLVEHGDLRKKPIGARATVYSRLSDESGK